MSKYKKKLAKRLIQQITKYKGTAINEHLIHFINGIWKNVMTYVDFIE